MKRKIIITLALALFIVLALCVTAFAEENVPEVTHEYYLVQSEVTEDNKNATSGTYEKGGVNLSTVTCYSVSGTAPQA